MKNLLWKSKVQKKNFHEKAFFEKNWLIWSFYIIPPPLYLPSQSITLCPHLSLFFPKALIATVRKLKQYAGSCERILPLKFFLTLQINGGGTVLKTCC